jgi:hypothetical protein
LLIILVGAFIGALFMLNNKEGVTAELLSNMFFSILTTLLIWLGCMTIVTWLWKKYPWQQHPLKHLVIEVVLITLYTLSIIAFFYGLYLCGFDLDAPDDTGTAIFITLMITYLITAIHEAVFFYRQWKFNFSKSVKLERDNIEARYEALRSQINPHFLFNSLNSLTTLVDGNQPAVNYITSLSELMRYMLKSNEKELVLLREEIRILKHYLQLQKMRFKENLIIEMEVPESFYHYAVPPLALQMLVENAIKHNVITEKHPLRIVIRAEKGAIVVENNLQRKALPSTTGQGLKNISGRYHPFSAHKVKVEETSALFRVTLPLLTVEL